MKPSPHGVVWVMFPTFEEHILPAGQGSQLNTLGAPRSSENVPSGQLLHATEFKIALARLAWVPAVDEDPTDRLYVPGGQIAGVIVPGSEQLKPGGHGKQIPRPGVGANVLLLHKYA